VFQTVIKKIAAKAIAIPAISANKTARNAPAPAAGNRPEKIAAARIHRAASNPNRIEAKGISFSWNGFIVRSYPLVG